jgi:transcriptional regulator with XRE-family HTH domain
MTNFHSRLAEAVTEARISKAEIERRVGCSHSHLDRWLNGETLPRADYLAKICKTLAVSADWLLGI